MVTDAPSRPDLELVVPDDGDEEFNRIADDDDQTFVCGECGDVFNSARGLNIHVGHRHVGRDDLKRTTSAKTTSDVPVKDRASVTRTSTRKSPKDKKVEVLQASILQTVNPLFIKGALMFGIPEPMLSVTLGPPAISKPLEEELQFTKMQAGIIARGLVEMEGTPIAQTVLNVVGPLVPFAFGIAAIGIVVLHGWKLFAIRRKLVELSGQMENGQQAMNFV